MKKLGLTIFILALAIGLIFSTGCSINNLTDVKGSGVAKTEARNAAGFDKVDASNAVNIEIAAGKDFSLSVETDDNLLQYLKTEVNGDTLKIYTEGKISPTGKFNVKLSMPELVNLQVSGATDANVTNAKSDLVILKASGASSIRIDGEAIKLKAEVSGASEVNAEAFKAEDAEIDASGASSAIVMATEELDLNASGASKIFHVGNPKRIKQNASDVSSIAKK